MTSADLGRVRYRGDIQGLRALAIALVVAAHAGVPALAGGVIGVDVFFVVSGFVITQLLLREVESRGAISLARFYGRRARRLLPMSTLVLVVTVGATWIVLGPALGGHVAAGGAWATVFLANVHQAVVVTRDGGQALGPEPLGHYWSLAVEEQFYLVWPLLLGLVVWLSRRVGTGGRRLPLVTGLVVLCAGSFAWGVVQTAGDPTWAFYSPATRAWELGVGALIAVVAPALRRRAGTPGAGPRWVAWTSESLAVGGLLAVVAAALVCDPLRHPLPGAIAALPVLGTAAVIAAGCLRTYTVGALALSWAPWRWLGDRSYSLYLWHWPLLVIASWRLGSLSAARTVLVVGAAVVAAEVSYRYVEQPIRGASTLAGSPRRSLALGVGLTAVSLTVCLI